MAGVLGRAFVQVFADLSKFSPGLREEIKKSLDEQTKGIKMEELDKSAEAAGESAAENVGKGMDNKIENEMENSGKKGGNSFNLGFGKALGGLSAAFMPALIGVGVEAAAALAPAALALAGTIPAAIGVAVGALAVFKLATSGVGATIKDAFDPTKVKQFNAEMKKLAPSARDFVKEIKNLHPAFHQLQQDVQEVFFKQLEGSLTTVAHELLPTLRSGLGQLAGDLGKLSNGLLNAFGNGREDIASIFLAAHYAIQPFIPLMGQVVQAFLTIGAVAGPLLTSLSGGFAGLVQQFVNFINTAADSGSLSDFFDAALGVLKQLGGLLKNVFGLVGDILGALQATGGQGLGMLGQIVATLKTFFSSAQGKSALVALFTLLNTAMTSLFEIIGPLLPLVGQLVTLLAGGLTKALETITPYLVTIANWLAKHPALIEAVVVAYGALRAAMIAVSIAEGIMDALDPLTWPILLAAALAAAAILIVKYWGNIVGALKTAWDAISSFFQAVWGWVVGVGKDIGNFFSVTLPGFFEALPGKIWDALKALPGLLGQAFLEALHQAGEVIGIQVGLLLAFFIKLPGWISDAVKSINHLFVDLWNLAFRTGKAVLDAGINAVVYVFTVLPGKILGFMQRLPGIIGNAFKTAWADAKRYVSEGADAVVGFVQKLPGRVSGFMRNVGTDILGGLKAGIDSVIGGFNSGIDKVSHAIHIGLPHLPYLASGGLVNAPTLAVVGEAGPEAVVPMSDPARAAAVAKSTGLLDMLGSRTGHTESTVVKVYLGTREITDILNTQIDKKLNDQANELAYGTR